MKKVLIIVLIFIVLLVVAAGVTFFSLNKIVRGAIVTLGGSATQTEVTVDQVSLSPFSGRGEVKGLSVGNPEGYANENAFTLNRVFIQIEPNSLFADTLVINEIRIEGPVVSIEQGLRGNNITAIRRNVAEFTEKLPAGKEQPEAEAPAEAKKKVVVERLLIQDGQVSLSSTLTRGKGVTLDFEPIEMTDIGKGDQVATLGTVVAQILDAITRAAVESAAQSGKLLEQSKELLLQGIKAPAVLREGAGDAANKLFDGLQKAGGGLFKGDDEEGTP